MDAKLTIELVPQTSWFSNLRSIVSTKDWNTLRTESYELANHRCEICNGIGVKHPVECHEVWEYDDENFIQKLVRLTSLCPSCHEVKHIGFANTQGRGEIAANHLAKINGWTLEITKAYIKDQFQIWRYRSSNIYELDLSWLDEKSISHKSPEDNNIPTKDTEKTPHPLAKKIAARPSRKPSSK